MPPRPNRDDSAALQRENARLRRAVEELSVLNELSREIGASHDLDDVLGKIVRRSLRAVGAEQGVVTLVDTTESTPSRTLVRTTVDSGTHAPLRLHEKLAGWMHLHRKPLRVDDTTGDDRFPDAAGVDGVHSALSVPLMVRGRLVGILTVFNKQGAPGFSDEDQRLLAIIAGQSAQVIENARLHAEEEQLLLVRQEMKLATEIQRSLLPKKPPVLAGYEMAAVSRPARSVGGDLFDYLSLSDDEVALWVGDVSGKGLAAALLMANVLATLRGQTMLGRSARECLGRSNRLLHGNMRRGSFVTAFYGILDVRTHRITYANAGHNRPLVCTADAAVRQLSTGGLVLGALPDFAYDEGTCTLSPGDLLLVYSDGVTEAMNPRREQFTEERLVDVLRIHRSDALQELLDAIVEAVGRHAGAEPQSDDVTLLAMRRMA